MKNKKEGKARVKDTCHSFIPSFLHSFILSFFHSFILSFFTPHVLVSEQYCKEYCNYKGISGEDVPAGLPACQNIAALGKVEDIMIDHKLSAKHTYRGSKAICHHHEEALCRVTNTEVCFLIYKEAAADVEEVEGYTIDYHRKYDEGEARTRVADGKEAKAQCPGKHCHEHHFLNAKTA